MENIVYNQHTNISQSRNAEVSINQFILEKELTPFGIWLLNIYRILQ